jgi:hypothetical protein
VNDSLLSIRIGGFVSDSRAGPVTGRVRRSTRNAVAKTVFPSVPYLVFAGVVVLKIVNDKIIGY